MTLIQLVEQEIELTGMNRDDVAGLTDNEIAGMNRHIHFLKTVHTYLQNPQMSIKLFNPDGTIVTIKHTAI